MTAKFSAHRKAVLFLFGGLLGILVFLLVYGIAPLDVTNDAFCRGGYVEKDIQQHYAGWLFYRQSDIGFPFCIAQGLNYPDGLSVAYTDSIPLFAALFRLLSPILPDTFQYFGIFTLLCFFFQGAFGALLTGCFSSGFLLPVLGDILFVTSPVLFERAFRHTALGAQFCILAALYCYFDCRRRNAMPGVGLFLLNAFIIAVHPYFLPMTYAVTLALLVEYAISSHRFALPAVYLFANLAATLGVGWAFGLFHGKASSGSDALYGYFGLNLNALWNPVGVGGVQWSRLLPAQNQVGGNYDAFAYLGLGILIVLPLSVLILLIRRRLGLRGMLRRHFMLAVVCLILSAFAVSNVVTANGATLLTIPLPAKLVSLFSIFRSSGRMFWPVYYLLILAAFTLVLRAIPRNANRVLLAVVLAALCAVQVWDISPGLIQRSDAMHQAQETEAYPSGLGSIFWQQAQGSYRHIFSLDGLQDDALNLALYAADLGMTTNDPFAARYDAGALADSRSAALEALASGTLDSQTLYLFHTETEFLKYADFVCDKAWCGEVRSEDGSCHWYVIAPGMQNFTGDFLCTPYDENYPLRIADYTDQLWNRGVLDSDKKTVCFADSPFTRQRLEQAKAICSDGNTYAILKFDDSDPGWLMLTLDIPDATVLWDKELETIS